MGRGVVIRPEDVRQIAAMVELDVPDEDLPRLAAEMERRQRQLHEDRLEERARANPDL